MLYMLYIINVYYVNSNYFHGLIAQPIDHVVAVTVKLVDKCEFIYFFCHFCCC